MHRRCAPGSLHSLTGSLIENDSGALATLAETSSWTATELKKIAAELTLDNRMLDVNEKKMVSVLERRRAVSHLRARVRLGYNHFFSDGPANVPLY